MIENLIDRLGGSSATISGLELREWEKLIFQYEVTYLWHILSLACMIPCYIHIPIEEVLLSICLELMGFMRILFLGIVEDMWVLYLALRSLIMLRFCLNSVWTTIILFPDCM